VSPAEAQDAIHAIEALSLFLTLTPITFGEVHNFFPTLLQSLLGLELAIRDYGDVLRRIFSSRKSLRSFYRQQKNVHKSLLSAHLQGLAFAVDEAITRLLRSHRDVLPTYAFPAAYDKILLRHLEKMISYK
jgi:hypothetical protein